MAIKGCVDGMEGSYVVGWAVSDPDNGNCAITIIDGHDEIVAKGRASRHRPDLASLNLGRTTLAFRIAVTHNTASRVLRVMANDQELPGSPVVVGTGHFDGYCAIDAATITGWITERVQIFTPVAITVRNQHGAEVGRGLSAREPKSFDPLFAPGRFSIELDDQCFGAGELRLAVFANDILFGMLTCDLKLQGNLETITAHHCAGWLLSPDVPGRSFEIEIFRDGIHDGTAQCEHEREDVRGIFRDCRTPGFSLPLTEPVQSVLDATIISLRMAGSTKELFKGPYTLAGRPAAVAAVYRVARLANMDLPGIGAAERAVLALALQTFLKTARTEQSFTAAAQAAAPVAETMIAGPRLVIIVPVYRGVEITRACIEAVLAHRNADTDHLLLINDASPDQAMAGMLAAYTATPNLILLTNPANIGFVQTVNRGFSFAGSADVLLLNADTVIHAGGLDELLHIANAHPEIGTVTAMSNNATIFSYPHGTLRKDNLPDISWSALAAAALAENAGICVDVPTGHGFCMLIKNDVIRRIGVFDEGFGRGYGEENDFCARSAAIGYRNVAAAGVLVEHKESISFVAEKATLLERNLPRLNALYPEYTPIIMDFERKDGLRRARWALDRIRLERAVAAGAKFVLVVSNALEGGTAKAIDDIERAAGYGTAGKLSLRCTNDGIIELSGDDPLLLASFALDETPVLFDVLSAAAPTHVLVHQMLGFPVAFISAFNIWATGRHTVFYAHDFYSFCPRVTMIDAIGRFCDVADANTCLRCVEMGGAHETSRLTELTPREHRAIFAEMLGGFRHVTAPSANAAGYFRRAFPGLAVEVIAHPESRDGVPSQPRAGSDDEIIMLGAIGAHKGSAKLLEIARNARLTHPHLQFRVIGHTNIDKQLRAIGNVTITGRYKPEKLAQLLSEARGRLALFLPSWPETYSYTLSETVKHGFIPLLPDIGAPAERVRAAQYGVVFPFQADAETILRLIDDIAAGRVAAYGENASPSQFFPTAEVLQRSVDIMALKLPAQTAFG